MNNNTQESQDCLVDPSTGETVVKALVYLGIFVVSLVGNCCILLVIYKNKRLRKTINYFVFNMAVSDLFNPLTVFVVRFVQIVSGSDAWNIESPRLLGNILCKLSFFLPDVSLVVSIESLLLISLERLVAVVFPLRARYLSSKLHLICILCTWVIAIAVHAPYFYTFRLMTHKNKTYCLSSWGPAFDHVETHKRYVTATFVTFVLLPICFLASVYGVIAWALSKECKMMKRESCNHQSKLDEQSRRIVRGSVAIIAAFAVCMIPALVVMFIRVFVWNWQEPPICAFRTVIPFIASFMLHAWSAVNPCICFIFIKTYRDTLRRVLCSRWSTSNHLETWDLTVRHPSALSSKLRRCRSTRV